MRALVVGILFAAVISTIIVIAISGPLHAVLSDICDSERRSRFWQIFTGLMLYLTPMLAVIVFGLDNASDATGLLEIGFLRHILGSALAGAFAALLGIALQLTRGPTSMPTRAPSRGGERPLFDTAIPR